MLNKIKKLFSNYIPTVIKTGILNRVPQLFFLTQIQPSSCTIIITNRCNLRCVMCRQWREEPGKELSAGSWKRIMEDLRDNGIKNIHFTGGEPLIRNDLEDLVAHARRRGFTVGMTTNGMLLDAGNLASLIKAGLKSVAVSVDAVDEAYAAIRGPAGSFKNVERAVAAVSDARRRNGIDAYIQYTLMKNNMKELRKVREFASVHRLPVAICILDKSSSIFDVEDNRKGFWISAPEDFNGLDAVLAYVRTEKIRDAGAFLNNFPSLGFIRDYFVDPVQARIPCVSSQDRIIVDPSGNLMGGCMSMGLFGDLSIKPFAVLKNEAGYRAAKKNMFYKRCPGCSCGYHFNLMCLPGMVLKDAFENIKYRIGVKI
jgi:pyruvate-formate lyase-activating enzyme